MGAGAERQAARLQVLCAVRRHPIATRGPASGVCWLAVAVCAACVCVLCCVLPPACCAWCGLFSVFCLLFGAFKGVWCARCTRLGFHFKFFCREPMCLPFPHSLAHAPSVGLVPSGPPQVKVSLMYCPFHDAIAALTVASPPLGLLHRAAADGNLCVLSAAVDRLGRHWLMRRSADAHQMNVVDVAALHGRATVVKHVLGLYGGECCFSAPPAPFHVLAL